MDGSGRRRTTHGVERKEQLLECAAALFAERGYVDTRVIDICRAAGVAKGLFYWYFENKEAVFRELAASIRWRLRRVQGAAMDPAAEPLIRLRQGTEASVRFMAEHARYFALLEAENATKRLQSVLREGTEVHVRDTQRLIEEGQAAGQVRLDDAELLARGAVALVAAYTHFHRSGRVQAGLDDLARFVARFVVRSVASGSEVAEAAEPAPSVSRFVALG